MADTLQIDSVPQLELKLGDTGPAVAELRQFLRSVGFVPGDAGNVYTQELADTVAAAQRKLGADPTGVWTEALRRVAETELPKRDVTNGVKSAPVEATSTLTKVLIGAAVIAAAYWLLKPAVRTSVTGLDLLEDPEDAPAQPEDEPAQPAPEKKKREKKPRVKKTAEGMPEAAPL